MITRSEFPPGTTSEGELRKYAAPDGAALLLRTFEPEGDRLARRPPVVYLHGIESHGGWFAPMAGRLADRGWTVHLLDRRGAGLNRSLDPGHAESAEQLLDDVRAFRRTLGPHHLIGLSWGGKLALASALRDQQDLRTLCLITPGLAPRVDLPLRQKLKLLCASALGRRAMLTIPIEPEMFTRTPRYLEFIEQDALRLERVSNGFLLAGLSLDASIRRGLASLSSPTLLLLAEHDRIVDNARTRRLMERAPNGLVRIREYRATTHSIQFDDKDELERDLLEHFGGGVGTAGSSKE